MPEDGGAPVAATPEPMPSDSVLTAPIQVEEGSPEAAAWATDGNTTADGASTTVDGGEQSPPATEPSNDGGERQADPTPADGASTTDEGDGEYDLTVLTEEQRARFKALDREDRKLFYQLAEQHVVDRIKANEEKTSKLEQEQADRDAESAAIRAQLGAFVGNEQVEITDEDGEVVRVIPSYDEIERLLRTRRGEDILDEKYGMTRVDAQDQLEIYDKNRKVLDASASHFDNVAWAKLGLHLESGLKEIEGIDPKAIVQNAKGPGDVVRNLNAALERKHAAEKAALVKDYEGRLRAAGLNSEALKGKAAAASMRSPETGGRTGGETELTLEAYQRMSPEEASKLSPAAIDRMYARLNRRR